MKGETRLRRELERTERARVQAVSRLVRVQREAAKVREVILSVEDRCLIADGPVTATLQEMTEAELRKIWKACKRIGEI